MHFSLLLCLLAPPFSLLLVPCFAQFGNSSHQFLLQEILLEGGFGLLMLRVPGTSTASASQTPPWNLDSHCFGAMTNLLTLRFLFPFWCSGICQMLFFTFAFFGSWCHRGPVTSIMGPTCSQFEVRGDNVSPNFTEHTVYVLLTSPSLLHCKVQSTFYFCSHLLRVSE